MSARRAGACAAACAAALLGACAPEPDPGWSGYVEGEYVYVAAPVAGRLVELAAQRGAEVARGAPLFALDPTVERAGAAEAAARAAAAAAEAADADKGRRRDEIAVTRAQLAQAQAQAALATRELARQRQLIGQGFVSAARLDDARAAEAQARARVAELQAALRVAGLPARSDARAAADAQARAAAEALEQARWRAQQTEQRAPSDARVAETYFRVGEWVAAGQPVVALLPPGATKARFFVPEDQLGAIRVGMPVALHCDGCGAPIGARVDFIATRAEYTPPVIYSNTQRARLVFMVEARPDAAVGAARLKPGQPVDVQRAAATDAGAAPRSAPQPPAAAPASRSAAGPGSSPAAAAAPTPGAVAPAAAVAARAAESDGRAPPAGAASSDAPAASAAVATSPARRSGPR